MNLYIKKTISLEILRLFLFQSVFCFKFWLLFRDNGTFQHKIYSHSKLNHKMDEEYYTAL